MKTEEKAKAREMRKKGMGMREIADTLNVAKSSISYWVRDVVLSKKQREKLNKNGHRVDVIEKRRLSRIAHTAERRRHIIEKAKKEVSNLMDEPLWCTGVALYWGEGGKTQQTARLSNSDPDVIKLMMQFFLKYSEVPKEKYHGHVHTFSKENVDRSVQYWSKVSGIPKEKFYKTYVKQSRASKNKRQTLPYGTMQIYIHDTVFFFRLMGWMQGLCEVLK